MSFANIQNLPLFPKNLFVFHITVVWCIVLMTRRSMRNFLTIYIYKNPLTGNNKTIIIFFIRLKISPNKLAPPAEWILVSYVNHYCWIYVHTVWPYVNKYEIEHIYFPFIFANKPVCKIQFTCKKVSQSHYRPEVPRGFQEVKIPRLRDNGPGWW